MMQSENISRSSSSLLLVVEYELMEPLRKTVEHYLLKCSTFMYPVTAVPKPHLTVETWHVYSRRKECS